MNSSEPAPSAFVNAARWELPLLQDFSRPAPVDAPPTAQRIEEIEAAAHREGQLRGHAEGYAAGLAEAREQAQRLRQLFEHLSRPLAELDSEVERALIALTLELARRLVQQELTLDPAKVAGAVHEAVAALGTAPRNLRVYLHPDDAELLKGQLTLSADVQDWHLLPDKELMRGDCRVATDSARVDARLDTRQAAIGQALLGDDA